MYALMSVLAGFFRLIFPLEEMDYDILAILIPLPDCNGTTSPNGVTYQCYHRCNVTILDVIHDRIYYPDQCVLDEIRGVCAHALVYRFLLDILLILFCLFLYFNVPAHTLQVNRLNLMVRTREERPRVTIVVREEEEVTAAAG